ncbi:rod shape-determining protein MreC [Pantoea sp. Aalb]|uniref:rod shape-determining protein MreC n=1 Tax=Pantoea sp. Aalb TaxID=2576762 RepID=UPI00132B2281|nr:rod shape-determining protein MreC [Pantoea sp. Aalb]MXP67663.1 rod shape-determining protein MreC [Pantoea sp. Aalb]
MKLIINKLIPLHLRFFLIFIMAIVLIIADSRIYSFIKIRSSLDISVSPLYFLINEVRQFFDTVSQKLISYKNLKVDNKKLQRELFLKSSEVLLLKHYKEESISLRKLLGSPLYQNEYKIITNVLSLGNNPYIDQLIIDKGSANGVYKGQAVIDDKGVVGQVMSVSRLTSRVLLICDILHAIPIQILRNDIRMIASGNGCNNELQLEHLPKNIDIRVGDILVASGIGNRFPEGYPVAIVSSVKPNFKHSETIIQAHPTASFKQMNYLLLWSTHHNTITSKEVNRIANTRLMHIMSK